MRYERRIVGLVVLLFVFALSGCGQSEEAEDTTAQDTAADQTADVADDGDAESDEDPLHVVVTTTILGDVVSDLVDGSGEVEILMPPGADPHGFSLSASDTELLHDADLIVTNGLGLEEGMHDALEAAEAEGIEVFKATDAIEVLPFAGHEHGHDHTADEEHADHDHEEGEEHADHDHEEGEEHADHDHEEGEEHADHDHEEGEEHADHDHEEGEEDAAHDHEEGEEDADHDHEEGEEHADHDHEEGEEHADHDHSAGDPHFWLDPIAMADVVTELGGHLAEIDDTVDDSVWTERAAELAAEYTALSEEIETILEPLDEEERVLVTNHHAYGYFANRYHFEVLGTVIPSGTTLAETSAQDLDELVETVSEAGVPAIFGETTDPSQLAEALAAEVGSDVRVETLYTGSLSEEDGNAPTYTEMLRYNATLIAEALDR